MLAQRFFTFLTFFVLCDNNILFGAMAADGVTQMNELLKYSGWRDLTPMKAYAKGKWCKVEDLLATDAEELQLVTYRNIDEKVQQAIKLLSCDYAIMFLTYIVYLKSICSEFYSIIRRNIGTHDQKQACLVKFRQLSDGKVLVLRMQSAIDYLKSMSPQTAEMNNHFSDILTSFGCVNEWTPDHYSEQLSSPHVVGRYSWGGPKEVIDENNSQPSISKTLRFIEYLKEETKKFFDEQCGPRSHLLKIVNIGSSTYSWSHVLTNEYFHNQTSSIVKVNKMYTYVNKIINDFIVSDYTHLGFAFNAESCTTVLNEHPDTENRVKQTNEILTHIGWSEQVCNFKFVMDKGQYSVGDLMATDGKGQIATEENVEYKLRLIYGFMNCYFVRLFKDLLSYKKSIIKLFFEVDPAAKFEIFISFVKIIKKSEPVILHMRDTLWYFRRLSPQTNFINDILKIIYFLMNSTETINLYQSKVYGIQFLDPNCNQMLDDRMRSFQSNLSVVEEELNEYNKSSCAVPAATRTNSEDPMNSQIEIEKKLDETIKSFIEIELPNFGFDITRFQGLL